MTEKFFKAKRVIAAIAVVGFLLYPVAGGYTAGNATITTTVQISVCGNDVAEGGEQCDGADLDGASCISRGFSGGTLACAPDCSFDVSACINAPPAPPAGGGGGGGGGSTYVPAVTSVVFKGRAYPNSTVTLLKDAQVVATTVADANALFSVTLTDLAGGNYIFSVYSEDGNGERSSLLTFPVSVTSGVTTLVTGVFIAPTIGVDKAQVKQGDNIAIFGQSSPNSELTIAVNSDNPIFGKTQSDGDGVYLFNLDTTPLTKEQHTAKSKAAFATEISSYSKAVSFIVGDETVIHEDEISQSAKRVDLNSDGKINLIDFSILAYWYKRPSPPAVNDLNSDGTVDLIDFSILAYHWTG